MKIIILVRILWTAGAQKIAIAEAKQLTKMGYKVKLVFLRATESGRNLLNKLEDIDYEIFSGENYKPKLIYSFITGLFMLDRRGEGTVDYNLINKFARSVKKGDADYIICHDQWAGLAGLKIKRKLGIPYSVMMHEHVNGKYNVPVLGKIATKMERDVLKNADKIFAVTEKIANNVTSIYGFKCEPDLVGMTLQKTKNFHERDNIILATSTWGKDRSPDTYLDIIEAIPDFKLYFIGRWNLKSEFEDFKNNVYKRNLQEKVIINDNMPDEELDELYASSKFVIRFGGTKEYGLGTATVFAISHLTPVIIDSTLGISDIITKYGGGYIVDKNDINKISNFILENNNEINYEKLQNNLLNITREYTWERHCRILMNVLK
ncbi:hypothetical protein [Thermoplasma volcanium GSS1]|uniref:Glycosyltransferase n=1 Tax=Thermoplasma volcanium (strain ATCC 51530 / DSM 4299 / JCM 9571 / NBRC 15438 / GSS1) TaxID=273116 RepID=Q97AB6_THEVO|nr:glycosyltransferase family 4 protein [Thermoplasma volcanium]BAB60036.1 hypothetical protein [Thermoplasma volcanium GSS1]